MNFFGAETQPSLKVHGSRYHGPSSCCSQVFFVLAAVLIVLQQLAAVQQWSEEPRQSKSFTVQHARPCLSFLTRLSSASTTRECGATSVLGTAHKIVAKRDTDRTTTVSRCTVATFTVVPSTKPLALPPCASVSECVRTLTRRRSVEFTFRNLQEPLNQYIHQH